MESLVHAAPTEVRKRNEHTSPESRVALYAAIGSPRSILRARPTTEERRIEDAEVVSAAARVSPKFLAAHALASRALGESSRAPALLCALLSHRDPALLAEVFPCVINTPALVRRFVGVVRSGVSGRRSLGSAPKRLIARWLRSLSDDAVLTNGAKLRDVIRLSHPRPRSRARAALYRLLLSRPYDAHRLPRLASMWVASQSGGDIDELPLSLCRVKKVGIRAPSEYLPAVARASAHELVTSLDWLRGFADDALVAAVATRLREARAEDVRPYALLRLLRATSSPREWVDAGFSLLDRASERSSEVRGTLVVDTSASMTAPLFATRGERRDPIDGLDVAALLMTTLRGPHLHVVDFAGRPLSSEGGVQDVRGRLGNLLSSPRSVSSAIEQRSGEMIVVTDDVGSERALARLGQRHGAALSVVDLCPTSVGQVAVRSTRFAGFNDISLQVLMDRAQQKTSVQEARWAS